MAYTIQFDQAAGYVTATLSGSFNFDTAKAFADELYAMPRANGPLLCLIDLRQCEIDMDYNTMLHAWEYARGIRPAGGCTAFVVARDIEFGMMRMYQTIVSGSYELRIFLDMEEAVQWLTVKIAGVNPQ